MNFAILLTIVTCDEDIADTKSKYEELITCGTNFMRNSFSNGHLQRKLYSFIFVDLQIKM